MNILKLIFVAIKKIMPSQSYHDPTPLLTNSWAVSLQQQGKVQTLEAKLFFTVKS